MVRGRDRKSVKYQNCLKFNSLSNAKKIKSSEVLDKKIMFEILRGYIDKAPWLFTTIEFKLILNKYNVGILENSINKSRRVLDYFSNTRRTNLIRFRVKKIWPF